MIYYDEFRTWKDSFSDVIQDVVGNKVVENLSSSTFEFIEDAGDFVASHTDIETISSQIHKWLLENEFCAFHGTRLLPEEIDSVQQNGLLPLVAADREHRLRRILERHPKWRSVEDKIGEVILDVGPRAKQGRREGQVHFSLSRSGLVHGFDHYLTHGSEFDQHVVQRLFDDQSGLELLKTETAAALIHVRMSGEDLVRGAHPFFSYLDVVGMGEVPGLGRTFLNAWSFLTAKPTYDIAKLRTDCCMMQRVATPPEKIVAIEKLGELGVPNSLRQN
jgi:hypothetical protein